MKITVCPATAHDVPGIAKLLTAATAYKVQHNDLAWDSGAWSEQEVAEDMHRNPMYCVFLDKELVGVCILQWQDDLWSGQTDDAGYLHRLAIKDEYHGLGLGAQIIDWAAGQVRQKNRQFLRLDCPADNNGLCTYYVSQGFQRIANESNSKVSGYNAAYFERAV